MVQCPRIVLNIRSNVGHWFECSTRHDAFFRIHCVVLIFVVNARSHVQGTYQMCRAFQTLLHLVREPSKEPTRQVNPCSRPLLQNLVAARILKNLPHFMEHDGSSPCSQHPVIGLYPERNKSRPYPHSLFKIHFNIILKFMYQSSTGPHF
jgi:hypothetical protein